MKRRPVQFGLGDLEGRLSGLLGEEAPTIGEGAPPLGPLTFVHTGEIAVGGRDEVFSTVLGSCVSVCLWDASKEIGGMNHFLLPDQVTNGISSPRFGNVAVRELLAHLAARGARTPGLQAKIFGGAAILEAGEVRAGALGPRNIELARVLLALAGIPVVVEDVGGTQGRKLIFRARDGAAWVRKL